MLSPVCYIANIFYLNFIFRFNAKYIIYPILWPNSNFNMYNLSNLASNQTLGIPLEYWYFSGAIIKSDWRVVLSMSVKLLIKLLYVAGTPAGILLETMKAFLLCNSFWYSSRFVICTVYFFEISVIPVFVYLSHSFDPHLIFYLVWFV